MQSDVVALVFWCSGIAVWAGAALQLQSIAVRPTQTHPPMSGGGYSTYQLVNGSAIENRLYFHGHHFLTILNDNGTFNLRPHPGVDPNGWGSSWYLQPFLPGAVLRGTTIQAITLTESNVVVSASGIVAQGASSSYGAWSVTLSLSCNPVLKEIQGAGVYSITLAGPLSAATGDLNLCKIASNYLDDVPLLDGSAGDTGDMSVATVSGQSLTPFYWFPPLQPAHFPNDPVDSLTIEVVGDYYQVDAIAQGYCAIQAAYKPSLKVTLDSRTNGVPMIFGGIYNTAQSAAFFADNVGMTPLILQRSTVTQYTFDVLFGAAALPADGTGMDADLEATFADGGPTLGVYFADSLGQPFKQLVGQLNQTQPGRYQATVTVPFPRSANRFPDSGFFIVRTPCN